MSSAPDAPPTVKRRSTSARTSLSTSTTTTRGLGGVDLVFDVIGGDIQKRSATLIRAGGTLVSITGRAQAQPEDGLAVDFVVESDRAQLGEIVERVRDRRLRTNIGNVGALEGARRRTQPERAAQGEDDHPRSSVKGGGQRTVRVARRHRAGIP
jgi:zinc-binding alcohol dehydrogenase family protein